MVKKQKSVFGDTDFEQIQLATADFVAAPDEGTSIPAGEVREIMRTEIEDDGQLASYDAVRLGGELDPTGNSAQGKIFVDLYDTSDAAVDDRTEIRFVARPKNGNRRKALTQWYSIRDLARDDPRQRTPLPPITDSDGDPQLVSSGRIIAMEVRNGATSVEVDKENSDITVPAFAGY